MGVFLRQGHTHKSQEPRKDLWKSGANDALAPQLQQAQ